MAKYGAKAQEKVEKSMHEMKRGTLRSGSGAKVTSRDQAIAIGLSEARNEGGKVPSKKASATKSSPTRSSRPRKASTKKSSAKGSTARRTATKKAAARKTSSKKSTVTKKK